MRPDASASQAFAAPVHLARRPTAKPREAFGPSRSDSSRRRDADRDFRPNAATALPESLTRTDVAGSAGSRRAHGFSETEPARFPLPRAERGDP